MTALDKNIVYHGAYGPSAPQIPLRAGPFSAILERSDLRYVKLGYREVVRRIYVAIRDQNWNTIPAKLSNCKIDTTRNAFQISFDADNQQGEVNYHWQCLVSGTSSGTITYSIEGEARSNFLRNRIGICVLHPLDECMGKTITILEPSGSIKSANFPRYVHPVCPFQNVTGMDQEIHPNVYVKLRFTGDVFETEDQRNWTDGSFKTYSTPLSIPYPVAVNKGDTLRQSVTLSVTKPSPRTFLHRNVSNEIYFDSTKKQSLPGIGLCVSSSNRELTDREIALLKRLGLSHLRVDIDLTTQDWHEVLKSASSQAHALDTSLEISVFVDHATVDNIAALRKEVDLREQHVRYLIFELNTRTTNAEVRDVAYSILKKSDGTIGVGTDSNFETLNLNRGIAQGADIVSFAINPQVHSTDDTSIIENVEGQYWAVRSARHLYPGTRICVSPVTLRPRFNPDAHAPEPGQSADALPPQVDPRQMSLLGACWTAGSLKSIATAGAYSATYYETVGWRGVIGGSVPSSLRERFPSSQGMVFPLYHVIADFGEFSPGKIVRTVSSTPLHVDGVTLQNRRRTAALIFNYRPSRQTVTLKRLPASNFNIRRTNERTVSRSMSSPGSFREESRLIRCRSKRYKTILEPYEIAFLDFSR